MSVLFAFLHHLTAFVLVAALAIELVLIRQTLTLESARRLQLWDGIYGASAGALLAIGLLRVFFFEKGAFYYWTSHAFLTKFGIFVLIGIASILPTIEFLKWRADTRAGRVPVVAEARMKLLRRVIHWELVGIVLILFFAAMMAKGGWR
jgi:putative membrane protein